MPLRRMLLGRRIGVDTALSIGVLPIFTAEALTSVRASVRCMSLPQDAANNLAYMSPFGLLEHNFEMMFVPWTIVTTMTHEAAEGAGPYGPPSTIGDWDTLYRRLSFEFGTDGNEFYGANPDGSGTTYDAVRNMWVRRRGADDDEGDSTGAEDTLAGRTTADEPLTTLGPLGIQRVYNREALLHTDSISNMAKNIPLLSTFLGAAGINDVVYSDVFDVMERPLVNGPGYLIIGDRRYATAASEGYSVSWMTNESIRAQQMLMGGDMERVNWAIRNGADAVSDYIRSILFGGDYSMPPADGVISGVFDAGSPLRSNDLFIGVKATFGVQSPYQMRAL